MCNIFVLLSLIYLGELANTVKELEEINHKLATLKAERDAAKGAVLPVLNVGSTHIPSARYGIYFEGAIGIVLGFFDLVLEFIGYCTLIVEFLRTKVQLD